MQNEPEKTAGNYNELRSEQPIVALPKGVIELQSEPSQAEAWQQVIQTGLRLVNAKVDEVLGEGNQLTKGQFVFPHVRLVQTEIEHPNWAGYFMSYQNEITLITGSIAENSQAQTKVFIHEYLHFLCHNGRDDHEWSAGNVPIAEGNNVGFRRHFGLDIREGREGDLTTDYFLSFNEAVTEQLAIDILPGVHETYGDYRGLLNQVIDDAVTRRLGSKNQDGSFTAWSGEQVKNYIYSCFFRGDLAGFTQLLKTTYADYDVSEQQFGLMTSREDLPSVIKNKLHDGNPGGPPPSPSQVALVVRQRLNAKTPADYVTDIISPYPGGDQGGEYDTFIRTQNITVSRKEVIEGVVYDIDTQGLIIHRGSDAADRLGYIREVLDELLTQLHNGEITAADVNAHIDELLFTTYQISMLSDGFRDFYVYKHAKLDSL